MKEIGLNYATSKLKKAFHEIHKSMNKITAEKKKFLLKSKFKVELDGKKLPDVCLTLTFH